MNKANIFPLAVFFCAAFMLSCSEEKPPIELPSGGTEYRYSFCVFIDERKCESGNFRSCRNGGAPSNSCPFDNVVETYSFCVFIDEERCEEGIFEYCYGGAALSNNCPYDEIVPIEESSSSAGASSSSLEQISSSSEQSSSAAQSSSSEGRGLRSSASKEKDDYVYEDYPTLEVGGAGVKIGHTTRYWDACKPHCSQPEHVSETQPWAICRNCDINSNEMPAYYISRASPPYYPGMYLGTPSGCDPHNMDLWEESPAYTEWKAINPAYNGSPAYTCYDMAPYVVNDTLAYLFAASDARFCGKCFRLQFDGDDHDTGIPRDTHRALKGKTIIVLINNTGVGEGHFDLMIPGGGVGARPGAFSRQMGVTEDDLGEIAGGFLSACMNNSDSDYYKTPIDDLQKCVREKCNNIFGSKAKVKSKYLLDGCLFTADWLKAASNPTVIYTEVNCPQYLTDKYRSTLQTEKPPQLW